MSVNISDGAALAQRNANNFLFTTEKWAKMQKVLS